MRKTASEVLRDLEIRVASLERQTLGQRMEENYRDSDTNVLFVANSLNDLLKKKGLHTELVAESGQEVSILIDNSLGDVMEKLQGIRLGVKWLGDDKLYHLGLMWIISENIDGDIYLTRAESRRRVARLEKQAGIFDIFEDNRLTLQELEILLYKTDAGPFEVVDVEVKSLESVDVTFENPKNGRTVTVYGYVQTHTGADGWFKQAGAQHFMALRGFPSFGGGRPNTINIPFNYDERDRNRMGSALGIKIDPKKKRVWLDYGDLTSDIG